MTVPSYYPTVFYYCVSALITVLVHLLLYYNKKTYYDLNVKK